MGGLTSELRRRFLSEDPQGDTIREAIEAGAAYLGDPEESRILWTPYPDNSPQEQAIASEADILFFGGAAGGGKTDLAIGLALTKHRRSIIFRREYPQLKGIEDRMSELVPPNFGSYNASSKLWRMRDGRRIELGACEQEDDVKKYQGRAHDLLEFDEVTHFSQAQVQFLMAWCRTTVRGQRARIVMTGNPPTTPEGRWVVSFFAPWIDEAYPNPAKPGELRWFITVGDESREVDGPSPVVIDGEEYTPMSRTFIPARIEDNPRLMTTGYRAMLQSLPEPLKSAFLKGNFQVVIEDDAWQVVPTAWVMMAQERWKMNGKPEKTKLSAVSTDVARGGKDKTVVAKRYANWLDKLAKFPGALTPDGPTVAAQVAQALGKEKALVIIDAIGVGSSVVDALRANRIETCALNCSGKTLYTDKTGKFGFANIRAGIWWLFREALDPASGEDIMLPPDAQLRADLCAPRYKLGIRGYQVEEKKEVKKRIGRSPDDGDACVMAFWIPEAEPSEGYVFYDEPIEIGGY